MHATQFPTTMVQYPTDADELLNQLSRALRVFANALDVFVREQSSPGAEPHVPPPPRRHPPRQPAPRHPLLPHLSCSEQGAGETRWSGGELFYRWVTSLLTC